MNQRINELFDNALDEAVPETWTTLNVQQLSKLKEKFAQLIVQECAEVVQEGRWMVPPSQEQFVMGEAVKKLATKVKNKCWNAGAGLLNDQQFEIVMDAVVRECMFAIVSRTDLPPEERKTYNLIIKNHFGLK